VQKRLVRSGRGPGVEVWEPIETGAPNHYWDCEVYQIAAAYLARVHLLPPAAEIQVFRQAEQAERRRQERANRRRREEGLTGWDVKDMRKNLR
jgi:hypothetical protein